MTWRECCEKRSFQVPEYPDWATSDEIRERGSDLPMQDGLWTVYQNYLVHISDMFETRAIVARMIPGEGVRQLSWSVIGDAEIKNRVPEAIMESFL